MPKSPEELRLYKLAWDRLDRAKHPEKYAKYNANRQKRRRANVEGARKKERAAYAKYHDRKLREQRWRYVTEEAKEQRRQRNRAYYVKNRTILLAKEATRRLVNKEARRCQRLVRYAKDPEKFRAKSRVAKLRYAATFRRWREANQGKMREYCRRRKAARRGALQNDLSHAQWLEIQASQSHRCYYCGKWRKGRLTQDHIAPVTRGGSHTLHNVIAACASCNSRKGTRPPPIPVQPLLLTLAAPRTSRKRRKI